MREVAHGNHVNRPRLLTPENSTSPRIMGDEAYDANDFRRDIAVRGGWSIAEVPGRSGGRGRRYRVYRVVDGTAKPTRDVDKSLFPYHSNCRRMSVSAAD